MPADYKSHGTRPEKKALPGFVWLAIGLVIGLTVALIIYLDRQPASKVNFAEAVQQELDELRQQNNTPEQQQPAKQTADTKEPKFSFYTILTELEVLIPDSELQLEDKQDDTGHPDIKTGKQYILQAGSFNSRNDAEKLKASLALLGLEANIQAVRIQNEQWHRVRVGPYNSRHDVYRSLNQLQQHGINAMALEIKP